MSLQPTYVAAELGSSADFPKQELLHALIEKGILMGDGTGDYALERTITRAEWLTFLKRVCDDLDIRFIKPSQQVKDYPELEGHWARDAVEYWITAGVLMGDGQGKLRLDDPITMVELLVILDRISQQRVATASNDDVNLTEYKEHWAYPSLNRLYQKGWLDMSKPVWKEDFTLDRLALRGEGLVLLAPFFDQQTLVAPSTRIETIVKPWDEPIDVNGDGRLDFSFRFTDVSYSLEEISQSTQHYEYLEEKQWLYAVFQHEEKVGEMTFQLKQVKGTDITYFIRYQAIQSAEAPFSIDLIYYGKDGLIGRTPVSELGEERLPYEWEQYELGSERELPAASAYLSGKEVDLRVAAVDTYRELGYTVRDYQGQKQNVSKVTYKHDAYNFTFTFATPANHTSETWGILAKSGLYDWERLEFANFMLRDDMSINKKLSIEGLYYRTPSNYYPRSSYSYYLNPANVMGLRAMGLLQANSQKGKYLDDFVIMLGHMSVKQLTNTGYWSTQPKSEWLEKDYHIGYSYYDNRRNADNAMFLLALYQWYPDEEIKRSLEQHLAFLYQALEAHSVHTSETGILFTDYVGSEDSEPSHIALNHHLAVLNFLLQWHTKFEDEEAKNYAIRMVEGIQDTEELWIKDNHDLYYALYADLTPHHYPDYIDLTLIDLQITQHYLSKIYGFTNESLDRLILSKQEWLNNRLRPSKTDTSK